MPTPKNIAKVLGGHGHSSLGRSILTIFPSLSHSQRVNFFTNLAFITLCMIALINLVGAAEPLTTEQIINRAEQQFKGKVIALKNSNPPARKDHYRIRLLKANAEIIIIRADKFTGEMFQQPKNNALM